ncbi:protein FAM227A isoform X1 [Rhincodon typus]|uniref:protein FAM227A isoform X1 n=2 Tax=Rhincodon typus TaxID=259920 RepID=UPI002030BD26|nr:protein FAM227A isoform X1 [Rhincodon typus]
MFCILHSGWVSSVKMVEINTALTPLALYEEDIDLPVEVAARRRQMVKKRLQDSPAPFVIGSMNLVNERIQHFSGTLHAHPEVLLVETRNKECVLPACIQSEKLRPPHGSKFPEIPLEKRPKSKRSDVQPKLVELQQYPGFCTEEPTPLPNETDLEQIWANVQQARTHCLKQSGYLTVFQQLLHSTLVQNLLLDTFWWIFLLLYQTDYSVQCQLFDRISKNYVQLIMDCQNYYYGDRFLQELPSTLSQAVYVSFCCTFPQSWMQFHNNDFRSQLCNIVYQWFGGVQPIPRIYNNWNYDVLLPQEVKDMKSRTTQDTDHDKSIGKKLSLIDFHSTYEGSCNLESNRSSVTSVNHKLSIQNKSFRSAPRLSQNTSVQVKRNSKVQRNSHVKVDNNQLDNKSTSSLGNVRLVSNMMSSSQRLTRIPSHKQSHVVGPGPKFAKNLFNLFGLSPLVLNFLQRLNLEPRAGENLYVTRTEIQHLPSDDAPTYSDVIKTGIQNLLKLKEMKQKLLQQQHKRIQ